MTPDWPSLGNIMLAYFRLELPQLKTYRFYINFQYSGDTPHLLDAFDQLQYR